MPHWCSENIFAYNAYLCDCDVDRCCHNCVQYWREKDRFSAEHRYCWLCRTVLCILLSKSRERINIHFVVMRSILRNSYQKPSWTWHRTRLRSNTIYEFVAQFTNASYMVANRYSFNPTPNNQKNGTPKEKKHEHQPDKNKHDKQKLEAHRNPDADMNYDFFIVHGLSKRSWRHCGQRFNSKENFACNKGKLQ